MAFKFFQAQSPVTMESPIPADPGMPDTETKYLGVCYTGWKGCIQIQLHVMKNGTMSLSIPKRGAVAINRQAAEDIKLILGIGSDIDLNAATKFFSNAGRPDTYQGLVGETPVVFKLNDNGTASLRIGQEFERDHFMVAICHDMLDDIKAILGANSVALAS